MLSHKGGTHGEGIKVGPPPNPHAFGNLPLPMSGLDIPPLAVGDTKTFIESGQETFLVGLAGIEVSSGAIISDCKVIKGVRTAYRMRWRPGGRGYGGSRGPANQHGVIRTG